MIKYPRFDGQQGVWYTADFSGSGDQGPNGAEAVVIDFTEPTTQPSASDSGCEASDFDPPTVAGKIVLLQRGTCDFGLKAQNASEAGAAGAVIFNEGTIDAPDRNDVLIPTLAGYDVTIPVIGTDYATGRSLVDLANGGGVTLRVQVEGIVNEDVLTNNVIAETPGGRADRTVVVGGHLDSVYGDEHGFAGPNGSGTIEQVFKDFWDTQGLAYETIPFDGRPDYDAFTTAGIPAGGIFAGAEVIKQPVPGSAVRRQGRLCLRYVLSPAVRQLDQHQRQGLSEHSDAAVHAILTFAQTQIVGQGNRRGIVNEA